MDLGRGEHARRAAEYVGGRRAVIRPARCVLPEPPPAGTNVIIVDHGNLMHAATTMGSFDLAKIGFGAVAGLPGGKKLSDVS